MHPSSQSLASMKRAGRRIAVTAEGCCQDSETGSAMLKLIKGIAAIALIVLLFPFLVLGFLVGK